MRKLCPVLIRDFSRVCHHSMSTLDSDLKQIKHTLVERSVGAWLVEEALEADHDGVEVQSGLLVFEEGVEADSPGWSGNSGRASGRSSALRQRRTVGGASLLTTSDF